MVESVVVILGGSTSPVFTSSVRTSKRKEVGQYV